MTPKDIFRQFLSKHFPEDAGTIFGKFELFHAWLVEENAKINLISRQANPDDIWTIHFLDSLLSIQHVNFHQQKVLDFGTGGGLPGIPLAIVFRDADITMLDSRKKKIAAVKNAATHLGLDNCHFIDQRLEELGDEYRSKFDLITSRSVRIEPPYKPILLKLLKPHGKIVLYKSQNFDDVQQFDNARIFDVGIPEIGVRKIVVA
jgi:16S rRNA (guanine527-N7)-methyltransferase